MGWWNQIKMTVTNSLGMISREERAIMALGQHLKDMGKACEDERIVMHAKKLGKRFFRLPQSTPRAGQIDWVTLTNELADRHPELVTRYPLLVARLQEQAQKDLIPPKWGHALLGLIDHLNDEQRKAIATQPAPITLAACPRAPAGGWGQAALVQLHHKSMDIETQRAMWDARDNTLRRLIGCWHSLSSNTKTNIFGLCITIPMLGPLVDILGASSATTINFSLGLLSAGLLGATFWFSMNSLSNHLMIGDDAKERVAGKLLATLKHHPQSQELVEFLDAHLDHPNIYGYWWRQLEIILDKTAQAPSDEVVIVEEHSSRQQLKKSLDELVVIDPDYQDNENEVERAADGRRTKL